MTRVIFAFAASLLTAASAFPDVHVTMKDGRVSIVARDATVRQILAEWARVGQTKIVNVDKIPGGPQTLELKDVTETEALDVLLRALSGYIAAPRRIAATGASMYDRIIIIPTVAGVRSAGQQAASTSPPPAPLPQAPQVQQAVYDDPPQPGREQADESAGGAVVMPMQANGIPVLNPVPRHSVEIAPQGFIPGSDAVTTGTVTQTPVAAPRSPTAPAGGVAVPGMIAPAPKPPRPGS